MGPKFNPLSQRRQHHQIQKTPVPQRQSGPSPDRSPSTLLNLISFLYHLGSSKCKGGSVQEK
jgi:hypothetical protein